MSAITREFTKEQLQEIIETDHVQCGEASALARIALASLEAEPIYQLVNDDWYDTDKDTYDTVVSTGARGRIVYTAPPAPVSVPDAISTRQAIAKMENHEPCDSINVAYKFGWNACRAAMLQGSAGNSPVIPDGWVMVPVDMAPEMMRAVQVNSELGAYAAANLTGAYSLFREFWDVAVTAAPQQEVK